MSDFRHTERCSNSVLEVLIDHYGLEGRVSLPGNVSNPYSYMARAKAFVLSSRYEGLPTVLVEAMACECPVVSTDCPGVVAEILSNGKYGHLTPNGNPTALADAIVDVLKGHGRYAPTQWLRQFELEPVVDQYIQVLNLT